MIDLHCHTRERSRCGLDGETAMIQHAIRRGLDGLAFTDHDSMAPEDRLRQLNEAHAPFRIFTGVEITCGTSSTPMHFLAIGVRGKRLEDRRTRWRYGALRAYVHKNGGFLILAHPFRYETKIPAEILRHPPDAVEIHSTNIVCGNVPRIAALAKALNRPVIAASDAHSRDNVGLHAIRLNVPVRSDRELVAQLRLGAFSVAG